MKGNKWRNDVNKDEVVLPIIKREFEVAFKEITQESHRTRWDTRRIMVEEWRVYERKTLRNYRIKYESGELPDNFVESRTFLINKKREIQRNVQD